MRKAASIFSIVFGIVVLTVSNSRTAMEWITRQRDAAANSWWGPRQIDYAGDLAGMGYLDNTSVFRDTVDFSYSKAGRGKGNIDLYVWGDSYTMHVPDSAFYGLNAYHFGRRDYTELVYKLDTSHINILIIELGERFIRWHFPKADYMMDHVYRAPEDKAVAAAHKGYDQPGDWSKHIFNPKINANIEYNLFSYGFFAPVRQLKAELNAFVFGRGSGDVAISNNGKYLFYKTTVKPKGPESGIEPVPQADLDNIITQINKLYDHYRAEGFDEVYLTIPPNPVSLLQPEGYNRLLPNLQNSQKAGLLKIPIIDIYDTIVNSGNPLYFYQRADTHWGHRGQKMWIGKVNRMLQSWDSGDTAVRRRWW